MTCKAREIGGNSICLQLFYVVALQMVCPLPHTFVKAFLSTDAISFSIPCIYTLQQLFNRKHSHLPTLWTGLWQLLLDSHQTLTDHNATDVPGSLFPSLAVPLRTTASWFSWRAHPYRGEARILLYCSKHAGSVLATEVNKKHYPVHNIDSVNWQVRCWTGLLLGLNCICTEHCLRSSCCRWERLHTG